MDFITSPRFIEKIREEKGLYGAPEAVITDKAVMAFDDGETYVDSSHPGVTKAEVVGATGWDVDFVDE